MESPRKAVMSEGEIEQKSEASRSEKRREALHAGETAFYFTQAGVTIYAKDQQEADKKFRELTDKK